MTRIRVLLYAAVLVLCLASQGWCAGNTSAKDHVTPTHVSVLMYHKVSNDPTEEENHTLVRLDRFEEQMKYLADNGYTTVDLYDLKDYMEGRISLPEKSVVLTFDDGWRSIRDALPILKRYRFKATFFLVLDYLENNYPAFLNWSEIGEITSHRDFEIGCHSHTHPWEPGNNLVSWIQGKTQGRSRKDVLAEIASVKRIMEDKLQRPVVHYNWPSGWYNEELLAIARESGFITTVTTDEGANRPGMSPLKIRRYPVWGPFRLEQFRQLLTLDVTDINPLLESIRAKPVSVHDYPARK